jgi:restriction endonuclease
VARRWSLGRAIGELIGGTVGLGVAAVAAASAHATREAQAREARAARPALAIPVVGPWNARPPPGWSEWHYRAGQAWCELSDVGFEQALAVTFMQLGFAACPTPTSGDMGVDLVLTARDARRIAVQAKGHPAGGSVGYAAVQEVHTGVCVLGCHAAIVITNSRFTKQAKEASEKLRRTGYAIALIAGRQLPLLAAGQLAI